MESRTRQISRQSAFTLIEITIAILILASGLVILLGLQSSSIARAVRDRDKLQAMLLARQVLAAIESAKEPVQNQERVSSAEAMLEELLPEGRKVAAYYDNSLRRFQLRLKVGNWELPIPNFPPQQVKRLDLTVAWSNSPLDSLTITYFIPEEPPGEEEEFDDEE